VTTRAPSRPDSRVQGPTTASRRLGPLPSPLRRVLGSSLLEGLATPHGVSHYLEALHPLWSLEGGRALVEAVTAETADMVTLTLRPDQRWDGFTAGQHVRVGVEIEGTIHTRTYSLSGSAHRSDGRYTVTVKRKEDGLVSGHLTTNIRPGDVLHASAATGDVVLPDPRPQRLLLVSAGSGITPLASMLATLADEAHEGRVTFLHYARTPADVPFADDLARIAQMLPETEVILVPTATRGDGPVTGRFAPQHLDTVLPEHREVPTFACGPAGFVDAIEEHYDAASATDVLSVERFSPPALRANLEPGEGTVRFAQSNLEVDDDGTTLLEQAESAGLTPEFGCRMGICHTCTRTKTAGSVVDLRNGRRSDTPEEKVQICVSAAAGDVILDL
jgi:stearoyl-CoA 9-desaturase NADPH oxidoreductase